jgi:hypothetical protein
MARVCGSISAPNAPCAARKPVSQHSERRRQAARQGGQHEAGRADQENPLAPEVIPELAAGDQAPRRQQVRVRNPLQTRQAGVEMDADDRVRDRDDRAVQGYSADGAAN